MDTSEQIERPETERKVPLLSQTTARKYFFLFVGLCAVFLIGNLFFLRAPADFPVGRMLGIEAGESLQSVTETLYSKHIIRSPLAFRTIAIVFGGERGIIAGDYLLDTRDSAVKMAYRLVRGKFHLEPVKITIPEGWNVFQISTYLDEHLIGFDTVHFLELAKKNEGYLFPDTYFVSPIITPEVLVSIMRSNFSKKIALLQKEITASNHSEKDIIIMASIIEEEARTPESRRLVAGILWKRLVLKMPLQVDSAFSYVNGKNTYTLTASDLRIDSLYNTYKYVGLTPGPISNPGSDSIEAAINPTESDYVYFLTGKDGEMHYAKTFEEHKRNKVKYL